MTASPDRPGDMTAAGGVSGVWTQLAHTPAPAQRVAALRRFTRQAAWLAGAGLVVVVLLMLLVDVPVITAMPRRGAPEFAPLFGTLRVITDFGKAAYVLWSVGLLLVIAAVAQALVPAPRRRQAVALALHLAYVFAAVAIPILVGEGLKGLFGRARPFVGGHADAFHFVPWTWHEPFFSLPSAHAITAVALASAVAMAWPRTRVVMALYAVVIVVSRVALLDHHPSDVVAGGLLGLLGALLVRQVFAGRGVGFAIGPDGRIKPAW